MDSPLTSLDGRHFDVLILGGGITGCAAARRLALDGLSVLLVEPRDFGWGTSGRSSRLIHGGLRYLASGRVGLVRAALHQRWALVQAAPHLVRPCPFVLPFPKRGRPWWRLAARTGVWLYDQLSRPRRGWPRPRPIDRAQVEALLPGARFPAGTAFLLYHDAATDDRRLTLLTALDARRAGARLAPRCELVALDAAGRGEALATLRDSLDGALVRVRVRAVVNATGPWADRVRRSLGVALRRPLVRPTRGAHLMVALPAHAALLTRHPADGRIVLTVPTFGGFLVGTTDEDDERSPDRVRATAEDVAYLEEFLEQIYPDAREAVRAGFAGLRPLAAGVGHPDRLSRRHRIFTQAVAGVVCLSVIGGKLTAHRAMARDLSRRLKALRGIRGAGSRPGPSPFLPGGDLGSIEGEQGAATAAGLSPLQAKWMVGRYGSLWRDVLGSEPEGSLPVGAEDVPLRGEIRWSVEVEGVRTLSDLMLRWHAEEISEDPLGLAQACLGLLAALEGWSSSRQERELERWRREREMVFGVSPREHR